MYTIQSSYLGEMELSALREKRKQRILDMAAGKELEALVVCGQSNLRYVADLRNVASPDLADELHFLILKGTGEIVVFTQVFASQVALLPWITAAYDLPAWTPAPAQGDVRSELILQGLKELGVTSGRIGVDVLPFQVMERLRQLGQNHDFISVFEDFQHARQIKFNEEILLMEAATTIGDIGADAALNCIKEGIGRSEYDVAAAAMGAMSRAGCEGYCHYPALRSGERALVNLFPNGRYLREGDSVIFDIGCYGPGGYTCDMARTGFVGTPNQKLLDCYKAVREAIDAGIETAKVGARACDLHAAINRSLVGAGYAESPYANGHGTGLAMAELPAIASTDTTELQPNMTICLEPLTFADGLGAVKIEDVILVTDGDARRLTRTRYWPTS